MKKYVLIFLLASLSLLAALLVQLPSVQAQEPQPQFAYYLPLLQHNAKGSPLVRLALSSGMGTVPLTLTFDASQSEAADSSALRFQWQFGDGWQGQGARISHTYTQPGFYLLTLTVTDGSGRSSEVYETIQVNPPALKAKNVILFIGDGMGPKHIQAAGIYQNGQAGTLPFESFPYRAEITTYSASSAVTDSAAAATAMATGSKVNNGVISRAIPGDDSDRYTLLEYARDHGLSTGLVTTVPITHATPAGFGAHAVSRLYSSEIASDYLTGSHPNLLFGGGGEGMSMSAAQAAGYQVVTSESALYALDTETAVFVSGQLGSGAMPYILDGMGALPTLSEMTTQALAILDNDPDGFFVMIEGGKIDTASHANDTARMLGETVEFANAVQAALDWAASHPDTLIVVLADHETGGLSVTANNGAGALPGVTWSTTGHTATNVTVFATGPAFEAFPSLLDNTAIPALLSDGRFPGGQP